MNTILKTAVYAALDEKLRATVTDWEINFHISEAQRLIATLLPAEMCPEVIRVEKPQTSFSGLIDYGLSVHPTAWAYIVPSNCLQALSVMVDTVNIGAGHTLPVREFAREVKQEEFFSTIGDTQNPTVDKIWCQQGSTILTNFRGGTGTPSDTQIIVKYKIGPADAPVYGAFTSTCAYINVSWDLAGGDHSLLKLLSGTWAAAGITPASFTNGTVIEGVGQTPAPYVNASAPCARIIKMWDDGTNGWLQARGPRSSSNDIFSEWTNTYALIVSAPLSTYDDAIENAYLSNKWNMPTIDIALSNLWLKLGDGNRAALYLKSGMDRLQMLGVSVKGAQ